MGDLFRFEKIEDGIFYAYVPRARSGGDSTTRMATVWAIQALAPIEGWDGYSITLTYSDGETVTYLKDFDIK